MICQKCGALNNKNSWRCRSCFSLLRNEQQTETENQSRFKQADLLQGQEPNLTRVDHYDIPGEGADRTLHPQRDRSQSAANRQTEDAVIVDIPPATPSNGNRFWMLGSAGIAGVAVIVMALIFFGRRDDSSVTEQYAQAEQLFQNQQFIAALPLYQEVIAEAPSGNLAALAKQRIAKINDGLTALSAAPTATEQHVAALLVKAEAAFEKESFLTPTDDNVVLYTDRILELDPTNSPALNLRAKVISFYEDKAESSLKRRRYSTAVRYYQNILKVVPGDSDYTAKLQMAMDRKARR